MDIILEGLNNLKQIMITNDRCLKIIEYDVIIEQWCHFADTEQCKSIIRDYSPFGNPEEIIEKLNETDEAIKVLTFYPNYHFGGIYQLDDLIKRAQIGSILGGDEFIRILSTIEASGKHQKFYLELDLDVPILKDLSFNMTIPLQIEKEFKRILNSSGELVDEASSELFRIRREIRSLQNQIRSKLDSILKSTEYQKYFQDVFYSVRGNRYVIPIKQEYRHQFPGIVHDQSSSGHTLFIEPMALVEINNDLSQLHSAEKNEIEKLLLFLTDLIAQHADVLITNNIILSQMDFIFSKGKFSKEFRGTRPKISLDETVNLKKARHPLLDPQQVVPISLEISNACKALVITGPNTGGKTVALKTMGILTAMHQSGLFIPAEEGSELPIFSGLFADIGDEQSLQQNLSTFSGHMKQIIEILTRLTDKKNLVLLDELGAGTDPEEGTALAIALLEKLMNANAKILLTSHYGELKAYAFSHPDMENASMEFDLNSLRPTYRLILGVPGESNALAIAKRLGLQEEIIQVASKNVRQETRELNELLISLKTQRNDFNSQLRELAEKNKAFLDEKNKFEGYKVQWKEKQEKSLEKLQNENKQFISDSKKEVETILSSLKEFRHGNTIGADLERKIQSEKEKLNELSKKIPSNLLFVEKDNSESEDFVVGDGVYIPSLKMSGTVLNVEDSQLWVEVGALKLKAPRKGAKKLAAAPKTEAKKDSGRRRISRINQNNEKKLRAQTIGIEIDVRGENAEDAILRIERFIDESIMAGSPFIRIIHGKGTGVLKIKIHEMLKSYPGIKNYNFAPLNQGGDGATEVQL